MKCLISLVQRRIWGHFGESRAARIQQIKHSHRSNAERMTEDGVPLLIHYHPLWSKLPIKHHSPAPQGRLSVRYKPWMPLRGEDLLKFIILVFRRAKSCTVEYTMTSLVSITAWQVPGRRTASCRMLDERSSDNFLSGYGRSSWAKLLVEPPWKLLSELLLAGRSLDWPMSLVYGQSGLSLTVKESGH